MTTPPTIPDTFNGQKTKYELFDGFRNASILGKILYVGLTLSVFGLFVPVIWEFSERMSADKAATQAMFFQQQERAKPSDKPASAYTVTPQEAQKLEDKLAADKRPHTEVAMDQPTHAVAAAR
jgi:hypothetical protein